MKRFALAMALACSMFALSPTPASAEDAVGTHELASVMERPDYASQLSGVHVEWSSATQYKCAAGFLMAGVALKGDVVLLD